MTAAAAFSLDDLIPGDVDRLLCLWAEYMQKGRVARGYPSRSGLGGCLGQSGRITCFDDLEDEDDQRKVTLTNTIMNDMRREHYILISNYYCGVPKPLTKDQDRELLHGLNDFHRRAVARGLL